MVVATFPESIRGRTKQPLEEESLMQTYIVNKHKKISQHSVSNNNVVYRRVTHTQPPPLLPSFASPPPPTTLVSLRSNGHSHTRRHQNEKIIKKNPEPKHNATTHPPPLSSSSSTPLLLCCHFPRCCDLPVLQLPCAVPPPLAFSGLHNVRRELPPPLPPSSSPPLLACPLPHTHTHTPGTQEDRGGGGRCFVQRRLPLSRSIRCIKKLGGGK